MPRRHPGFNGGGFCLDRNKSHLIGSGDFIGLLCRRDRNAPCASLSYAGPCAGATYIRAFLEGPFLPRRTKRVSRPVRISSRFAALRRLVVLRAAVFREDFRFFAIDGPPIRKRKEPVERSVAGAGFFLSDTDKVSMPYVVQEAT